MTLHNQITGLNITILFLVSGVEDRDCVLEDEADLLVTSLSGVDEEDSELCRLLLSRWADLLWRRLLLSESEL